MYALDFLTEQQNAEISVASLKSDFTTDALSAIWKHSEQTKETLAVESLFGIVIGGWFAQLKFLKRNSIKDVFW